MSNNITIRGYLTENPTVNSVNDKRDVLNFTIASTRSWPDGQGGFNEKTEFFDCVMFREKGKFNKLIEAGRFMKGTDVKVNRAYMETKKNETEERTYTNYQWVVDGFGDVNAPAMDIISSKAERDYMKMAVDQGCFVQANKLPPAGQPQA